jgi:hypothetical protein
MRLCHAFRPWYPAHIPYSLRVLHIIFVSSCDSRFLCCNGSSLYMPQRASHAMLLLFKTYCQLACMPVRFGLRNFNGYNGGDLQPGCLADRLLTGLRGVTRMAYNGYNGGWPSARLFGWSAADWSRPATNKSISSERKKKSIVLLRKEIVNKLVVDLLQQ